MNNLEQLKRELLENKNKCIQIKKKIEELEKQEIKVRWRAKEDENYYYFTSCGEIYADCDGYCDTDNRRYELGDYFKTEEEAENVVEKFKIYTQLKDLALRLNKGVNVNWRDCRNKYSISYDTSAGKMVSYWNTRLQEVGQIYCLDENFLEVAKEKVGEENLRKLFE